jgi:hypothetical protein
MSAAGPNPSSAARLFGGQKFAEAEAGVKKLADAVGLLAQKVQLYAALANNAVAAGKKALAGDLLDSLVRAKGQLAETGEKLEKAEADVEKLATAIGKQLGETIKGTFQGTLAQGLGVLGQLKGLMASTLQVAAPGEWVRLQRTFADLSAVIGRALLPVFEQFRETTRAVADFILNLSPGAKKLAVIVAELALAFGVGSKAISLLGTFAGPVFTLLEAGFAALIGEATALNVLTAGLPVLFGLVATAVGGLVVAGSQAGAVGDAVRSAWEEVKEALAPIGGMIAELIDIIKPLAIEVGSVLVDAFRGVVSVIKEMVESAAFAFAVIEVGLKKLKTGDFSNFESDVAKKFDRLTGRDQKDKTKQSSFGAAASPASYTTLEGLGQAARASAFGAATAGKSAEDIAQESAQKAAAQRDQQIDLLGQMVTKNDLQTTVGTIAKEVVANLLTAINPLAGLAMRLKF